MLLTERSLLPRRRLGRTRLEVTELSFGGTAIGNMFRPVDDEVARSAIEAAWDGGIRYFDTAPHYGLGLSEQRLGQVLAGKPREDFVVSTKVGRLLVPNSSPVGSDLAVSGYAVRDELRRVWDFSRDGVRRSLEASLTRLGLDRVDIVFVHDPEDHLDEAINEALPALIELRDEGVIGAVGAGMNYTAPLSRIAAESDVDVLLVAGRWTLIDRSAQGLLDQCGERGIAVLAAAPFNSGLLARSWPHAAASFNYGPTPQRVLDLARAVARTCTVHDVEMPHAALRFPFSHPAVCSVICGMRSAAQVAGDVQWATTDLGEGFWRALRTQYGGRLLGQ
jgi:D-threo-aldose 1-dehydrogenase